MNNETQPTPEQLAKWREEADYAYCVTGSGILKGYNKESFEAGYLRAKQENVQALKDARKQSLEEAIAINHKLAASPEDVSQVVFASVINRKLLALLNE